MNLTSKLLYLLVVFSTAFLVLTIRIYFCLLVLACAISFRLTRCIYESRYQHKKHLYDSIFHLLVLISILKINVNIRMAAATTLKRSPITAATITPPSLNRQHSYNSQANSNTNNTSTKRRQTDATTVLANVASRAASPRRKSDGNHSPLPSPLETPNTAGSDRRISWEECMKKREGYISFPDFDQLRAERREQVAQ